MKFFGIFSIFCLVSQISCDGSSNDGRDHNETLGQGGNSSISSTDSNGGGGVSSVNSGGGSNGCGTVPWESIPSESCFSAQKEACAKLAPSKCSTLPYCTAYSGRPIVTKNGSECLNTAEPIYCMHWYGTCAGMVSRITAANGNTWLVPSDCNIPGFTIDHSNTTNLQNCSGS
jgi:hypothetical protein